MIIKINENNCSKETLKAVEELLLNDGAEYEISSNEYVSMIKEEINLTLVNWEKTEDIEVFNALETRDKVVNDLASKIYVSEELEEEFSSITEKIYDKVEKLLKQG